MNYRRGAEIGRGGMSDVFEGVALEDAAVPPGTVVALKYLREEFTGDSDTLERFFQEILTCSRLKSPNITRGFDVRTDNNRPVFIMERLYGESLRLRLRQGPIGEAQALGVAASVVNGLGVAHEAGVVHRDIKPGNIHLGGGWPGAPASVKILDFGIARLQNSQLTLVGTHLGTPTYMSPEQIENPSLVDARSDFYSLGVVLYEALCGHPPFKGTDAEVMRGHVSLAPPALPTHISPHTRQLVSRMLAKNPAARPQTAFELRTQLGLALSQLNAPSAPSPSVNTASTATLPRAREREQDTVVRPAPQFRPQPPVPSGVPTSSVPASPRNSPYLLWGALGGGGVLLLLLFAAISTGGPTGTPAPTSAPMTMSVPTSTEAPPASTPEPEPEPTATTEATVTPRPTATTQATATPRPTSRPTAVPTQVAVLPPTPAPRPTRIPRPTFRPRPTRVPRPTFRPRPTRVPRPTSRPRPKPTPEMAF